MFKNGIAGYNPRFALTHPWKIVEHYYYEVKYALQRAFRGYSDRDNWSIDGFLLQVLPPMIKNLRKHNMGYPVGLTNPKWKLILFEIEEGLIANRKLCNLEYDFKNKLMEEQLQYKSKKGLRLFFKYFNSLWD